jgi:hypothetical protein
MHCEKLGECPTFLDILFAILVTVKNGSTPAFVVDTLLSGKMNE